MMKYFLALAFLLSVGVSGLKWIDKRNVTTSLGKKYSCYYTIVYNATQVFKGKSSVTCRPNTNGGLAVENFNLPGKETPVRIQHNVRDKNPEQIKWIANLETMPAQQPMPLNCSCAIPLSGLMGSGEMVAAGRKIMERANNREMAESRMLFGPLLFFLLLSGQLTNLINAITGATGRSLNIEASSEDVNRILEAVRSGDTTAIKEEDRTLLFLLIQQQIQTAINNIRTQIQTAINNFIASLLGTATGRSNLADIHHVDLTDEANDRTLLLSLLLGNIQTQIQTAIQTAINNFLAALGLPVAGRSLNRQFPLLESLTGSGGGDLLGSLTGGEELLGGLTGDLGGLESLLGLGGTTTDADLSSLLQLLGMSSPELTELMTFLEQLEQMSDEEFMAMMMQEMGVTEAEMAEWFSDIPLHCGCIPDDNVVTIGRK